MRLGLDTLALALLPIFANSAQAGTIFCRQLDAAAAIYTLSYETNPATREGTLSSITAAACKDGKIVRQTVYDSFAASPINEKFPFGRYIVSNAAGGGLYFSLRPENSVCPWARPWPPKKAEPSKKNCFSGELVDIAWLEDGDDPAAFAVKIACGDLPYLPPLPCRTDAGPFYPIDGNR